MVLTRTIAVSVSLWTFVIIMLTGGEVCPPLPYTSLRNGDIVRDGLNGFFFKCNKGYYLGGDTEVYCYKGNWTTEKAPVCYEKDGICDPPAKIPNATLFGSPEYKIGSVVQYLCDPGFIILGDGMRVCQESEFWSGITPACIDESEPLQNLAERLGKEFITKLASHSANRKMQQAYYLDPQSIKEGLELVILIDRSSSVDPFDLNIGKDFIKFLFREFGVRNGENPLGARATVIAFGTNVDVLFNLDDENIDSPEAASEALDERLKPNGGGTAMVPALTDVIIKVWPYLRDEAKLALFLISDGEPNVGGGDITPEDMARQLKEFRGQDNSFEIFAVGIGPDVNRQTLASVASEPVINHVFLLKKYTDLGSMMSIIQNKPTEAPPIRPGKCGHFEEKEEENHWPWTAAVYVSLETVNFTKLELCGGVLICSQWVLTSASCFFHVQERDVTRSLTEAFVVLGEDDLVKVDTHQTNFYAVNVTLHPDYVPQKGLLDNLALIKLNEPVPIRTFRPVCLPPTDGTVPLHLNQNLKFSVAGWGTSPSLDTLATSIFRFKLAVKPVVVVDDVECRRTAGRLPENSIFCAEFSSADRCVGIHGSPVVAQDPRTKMFHVLGILSQKDQCRKGYSQYVNLIKYIPWINEVTDKCHLSHWS